MPIFIMEIHSACSVQKRALNFKELNKINDQPWDAFAGKVAGKISNIIYILKFSIY